MKCGILVGTILGFIVSNNAGIYLQCLVPVMSELFLISKVAAAQFLQCWQGMFPYLVKFLQVVCSYMETSLNRTHTCLISRSVTTGYIYNINKAQMMQYIATLMEYFKIIDEISSVFYLYAV